MKGEKPKRIFAMYGKYSDIVTYEYRGRKYEVEYPKCWTYLCTKPWIQHKIEQEKIDEALDNPKPKKNIEIKPIDEQLDEIWDMLGWN